MQSDYDVIVIGAGYGGLSAGIYLQKCGFKTLILERTALPGGVSTPWRRKGYIFDGGTNWLAGSAPTNDLHYMLAEVIDFNKLDFVYPEEFMVVEHGGESFTIYDDLDKLRAEMMRISPDDKKTIDIFVDAIAARSRVAIPWRHPMEIISPLKKIGIAIKNAPFISFFLKWRGTSVLQFAQKFKSETLRQLFLRMFPHHSFFSMFAILSTFAWKSLRSAGYPVGGSEKLLDVMINSYKELGGELRFSSEVASIDHSETRVSSVTMKKGEVITADRVVAAMDGKFTFEKLLGEGVSHKQLDKLVKKNTQTYPGLFQVSVGTEQLFPGLRHKFNIDMKEAVRVGTTEHCDDMMIRICTEASKLSPEGTTTFVVHMRIADVEYWHNLRTEDREKYREEKKRIADVAIENLKHRFGDFEPSIVDTASPATYIRYSNAYRASYQGWAPTPELIGKGLNMKVKELDNFYMAGQWVFPAGGITGVVRVARHLTQLICHEEKRPFFAE